jgi:hypothetical protein
MAAAWASARVQRRRRDALEPRAAACVYDTRACRVPRRPPQAVPGMHLHPPPPALGVAPPPQSSPVAAPPPPPPPPVVSLFAAVPPSPSASASPAPAQTAGVRGRVGRYLRSRLASASFVCAALSQWYGALRFSLWPVAVCTAHGPREAVGAAHVLRRALSYLFFFSLPLPWPSRTCRRR